MVIKPKMSGITKEELYSEYTQIPDERKRDYLLAVLPIYYDNKNHNTILYKRFKYCMNN
jgi:hypothetical protein